MKLERCKKCSSFPEVIVPRFRGLYDDMPMMLKPIGPTGDSYQREEFAKSHPPYFQCPICNQIEILKLYPDLVEKWNQEQLTTNPAAEE